MAQSSSGAGNRFFKIRSPRDFWGGLALIAFAVLAFWASRNLAGMRGVNFGAGTAPRIYATALLILGVVILIAGVLVDGPQLQKYGLRGVAIVIASILLFAVIIRPLGIFLSAFVTYAVAATGSTESRLVETLLAAAAMGVIALGLFHYGLGLSLSPWPTLEF